MVLRDVADHLAPLHTVCRQRGRLSPWFDAKCRWAQRDCRRMERRYRRTRTLANRRLWVEATRRQFDLHRRKKNQYWHQRLVCCGRSLALLWRSLSSLLGQDCDVSAADSFAVFFACKVDAVRADTAGLLPPRVSASASSSLACFWQCTHKEICRLLMSALVKSCSLDPAPTFRSMSSSTSCCHLSPRWSTRRSPWIDCLLHRSMRLLCHY